MRRLRFGVLASTVALAVALFVSDLGATPSTLTLTGLRVFGSGMADPYATDGYNVLANLVADDENPYLLKMRNLTNDGRYEVYIGNDGVTYEHSTQGRQMGGGIGGLFLGAGNIYAGYSAAFLVNGGTDRAAAFVDAGFDVRAHDNSGFTPLRASTGTFSSAAGSGIEYACFNASGTLVRSAAPCGS